MAVDPVDETGGTSGDDYDSPESRQIMDNLMWEAIIKPIVKDLAKESAEETNEE